MSVLKGVVSKELYNHFLCLTVSISIMLYFKPGEQGYLELFRYAKELLKWYVNSSPDIYGDTNVSYNVHNLIHLHEDVENQQCGLESLSAFRFETFLHQIKKMVRKSHQPISQITKRISEMQTSNYTLMSKQINTKIQANTKNSRNSWFLLKNHKICEITRLKGNNQFEAKLYSFNRSLPYFKEPLNSKLLQICFLPKNSIFIRASIGKNDILKKFALLPEEAGTLLIPMLHDLDDL